MGGPPGTSPLIISPHPLLAEEERTAPLWGNTTFWESQALREPQFNGGGTAPALKPS